MPYAGPVLGQGYCWNGSSFIACLNS